MVMTTMLVVAMGRSAGGGGTGQSQSAVCNLRILLQGSPFKVFTEQQIPRAAHMERPRCLSEPSSERSCKRITSRSHDHDGDDNESRTTNDE